MSKLLAKQLLLSSNYWILNKNLIKILGIEAGLMLSIFSEAENMMADKEGWFYQTVDTIENLTGLTKYKQTQAINKLIEVNILEQTLRDVPPKRYFRINYNELSSQMLKNLTFESQKISPLKVKKLDTIKKVSNKESILKEYCASNDTPSTYVKDIKKAEILAYQEHKKYLTDDFFERVWKLYPDKRGKGKISTTNKNKIYKLGDEFIRCIDRYKEDVKHRRENFPELKYQNGSTFFNSGYVDYLDKNYVETKKEEKEIIDPYAGWDEY